MTKQPDTSSLEGSEISFAIAVPIGSWHPLLPRVLDSLAQQRVPLQLALLDASGDIRVRDAVDQSGLMFTYRREGPDAGQAAAIAEGWRATEGSVLGWLNCDDRLVPGALKAVSEVFRADQQIDAVYGESVFVDLRGNRIGRHDQVADISPLILRSNIISQPSCFIRRTLVNSIGGLNEGLHYTMDWDLWVRAYVASAKFHRLRSVLSEVYMGPETKTDSISARRLREMALLTNRHAGPVAAAKTVMATLIHVLNDRCHRGM